MPTRVVSDSSVGSSGPSTPVTTGGSGDGPAAAARRLPALPRSAESTTLERRTWGKAQGHRRTQSAHRRNRSYGSLSEIRLDVKELASAVPLTLAPEEWGPVPKGLCPPRAQPPPTTTPASPGPLTPGTP
eukprot:m.60049 g.60049  ORF g.60049 m.60049 type:complete len:130 (+) comp7934_c0_seq1:287-676(+)